ncbi:MAG: M4 family metallopeptidase [Ilumatobacteraceae bacterium]
MGNAADKPDQFCAIVPPHLLLAMAAGSDRELARRAAATLDHDRQLRASRTGACVDREQPGLSFEAAPQRHLRRCAHDVRRTAETPDLGARAEGAPPCGDVAVDQAYDGTGAAFDFFWDVFARDSIDGSGITVESRVHHGQDYANAFWNGAQLVFGDGDGLAIGPLTGHLDVIGHEFAHGVTDHLAALERTGQAGALAESVADVFGSMVKQFAAQPRQTTDEADWLIGDGIFLPGINGRALRSVRDPGTAYDDVRLGGKDPQPAHMDGYVDADDECAAHINSGIPNRAFWLVASAFGGYAWERAGQIWYETLRDHRLSGNTSFEQFAGLTCRTARMLYGEGVAGVVAAAWHAVGVGADVVTLGSAQRAVMA